jgi:ABC-2 type transport system permease protein/sodium transport system permease protein
MAALPPPRDSERSLSRWLRLARKELQEILRDRRTIFTLVLMPLLLYPLLGFGFSYLYATNDVAGTLPQYRLGFENNDEGKRFQRLFHRGEAVWLDHTRGTGLSTDVRDSSPSVILLVGDDLEAALREGTIDLAIRAHRPAGPKRELPVEYQLLYNSDSAAGREAARLVRTRLVSANLGLLESSLAQNGENLVRPLQVRTTTLTREEPRKGLMVAVLVPLVLILMTMTGAVYPAIDLTAGERERGTLEMLMATPVSRVALLAAKYVAVLCVAILTALVNLVMMTATFLIAGGWLLSVGASGLSLEMVPIVVGLVVLFAAFYSAVLLVVASFARSFKEAQAYIVPLVLVSLIPGLLALVPELELGIATGLVPLLNIVLLARDLLAGKSEIVSAIVVIVSTALYALAALVLAARTFGAEAVVFRERQSWGRLPRGPAA